MNTKIFKLALLALCVGWFSCEDDSNGFQWNGSLQQEKFRPKNPGKKSSYFAIDNNIISFAVPYLVGTLVLEYPSQEYYPNPGTFSPHFWTIHLIMAKGTDVTKLAPVITLTPGATITRIEDIDDLSKQVNYTGIAEVGVYNFKHQVDFTVLAPDGSTVTYKCSAVAIGDVLPCIDCP